MYESLVIFKVCVISLFCRLVSLTQKTEKLDIFTHSNSSYTPNTVKVKSTEYRVQMIA